MIERNLQSVTIRKYGTAFLEAFGMLPLTYFGAVGDNVTDNYANIQVAVDESILRGLRYIFVPDGKYYYYGVIDKIEQIIFIGNATSAKIYNQDNEEIPVYQIGTQLPFEKGTETFDLEINNDGYIDISTKTKNPSEAILVLGSNVIHVVDDLILLNGSLIGDTKVYLVAGDTNNVYIDSIELLKTALRINYKITGTGGTLNSTCEWRVR